MYFYFFQLEGDVILYDFDFVINKCLDGNYFVVVLYYDKNGFMLRYKGFCNIEC